MRRNPQSKTRVWLIAVYDESGDIVHQEVVTMDLASALARLSLTTARRVTFRAGQHQRGFGFLYEADARGRRLGGYTARATPHIVVHVSGRTSEIGSHDHSY